MNLSLDNKGICDLMRALGSDGNKSAGGIFAVALFESLL